jgi:hypothetical protein
MLKIFYFVWQNIIFLTEQLFVTAVVLSLGSHLRVELDHGVSSLTGYYLRLKSGMQQCSVSNLVFQKDLVSYATLISTGIAYFIFDVKCKYEPVSYLTPWQNEPNSTLSKRCKWKTTWYLYGEISCCRKWNNTKCSVCPGTNKQIIILVPDVSYRVGNGIHITGYSLNTKCKPCER